MGNGHFSWAMVIFSWAMVIFRGQWSKLAGNGQYAMGTGNGQPPRPPRRKWSNLRPPPVREMVTGNGQPPPLPRGKRSWETVTGNGQVVRGRGGVTPEKRSSGRICFALYEAICSDVAGGCLPRVDSSRSELLNPKPSTLNPKP